MTIFPGYARSIQNSTSQVEESIWDYSEEVYDEIHKVYNNRK